jgi:flagellar motor switch protein FliG
MYSWEFQDFKIKKKTFTIDNLLLITSLYMYFFLSAIKKKYLFIVLRFQLLLVYLEK